MKAHPWSTLAGIALVGALVGCQIPTAPTRSTQPSPVVTGQPASGTVFMWLSSDADAFTSCGPLIAGACPEENLNFGRHGILSVAWNAVALKKTYVHFPLPELPAGTVIEEAYFELYHPGRNEDGQTDNIQIPFGRAAAEWDPLTLTRANEPNKSAAGAESHIKLVSQSWSGSPDISGIVRGWLANPASNYGFHVFWSTTSPGIEKGFYSNNDPRRTATSLGLAPRLLVRMRLPDGKTSQDIRFGNLRYRDLQFGGQILIAQFSTGSDWPVAWEARRGR